MTRKVFDYTHSVTELLLAKSISIVKGFTLLQMLELILMITMKNGTIRLLNSQKKLNITVCYYHVR